MWGTPLSLLAADTPPGKPAAAKKETKAKARPFVGTVKAVDKVAKTITLEGEKAQTLLVTSETRLVKDDKPVTFDDVPVGESVTGSLRETAEGKLEAIRINVGKKPAKTAKPAPDKKK
jgi:hypothetical protein